MTAIAATGLAKRYGDVVAADDVAIEVGAGEIFVLIGPNGAGNTTTVEMLQGLRAPDAGTVTILGSEPRALSVRERIGVMPQRGDLYAGIKTGEALRTFAAFYPDPLDTETLLDRLDLARVRGTTYRRLSGGEKRRLSLALAIVGRPEVAFLDEPTAEMDVEGRAATWEIVTELRSRGCAVVLTTHQLDEAERIADTIAIIRDGRIVADGSPSDLVSETAPEVVLQLASAIDPAALASALDANVQEDAPRRYRISGVEPDPHFVSRLATWLSARGVLVTSMRVGARSLEDIYLEHVR